VQFVNGEDSSRLVNASNLSDTVVPSTPEGPGEMLVSPLGSNRRIASPRLSGVSRLMKTPKQQRQRKSAGLSAVKALMATPHTPPRSPTLSGKQLTKTPTSEKSPTPTGKKKLVEAPKDVKGTPELDGVRKLLKTPKPRKSVNLAGVKRLMKTPKQQKSPALDGIKKLAATPKDVESPELDGVRKLVKTPKPRKSVNLAGVKRLMKTPKQQKSPALDGVKKLLKTPKDVGTPELAGVRRLLKTPKAQKSPSLFGMKKLLKTPKAVKSPQLVGVRTLMKTPKQHRSPDLAGVRQLLKTPKMGPSSPDFVGVRELVTSPQTSESQPSKVRQKRVPKKTRGKEIGSMTSDVESSKTRGRKRQAKVADDLDVEPENLSVCKRAVSRRKLVDEDEVVVGTKVTVRKPAVETEMAKSRSDVEAAVSSVSPKSSAPYRGKKRRTSPDVVAASPAVAVSSAGANVIMSEERKNKSLSTPVAKTRRAAASKRDMGVTSSVKKTRTSKKTTDTNVLSSSSSMDQPLVKGRKAVKSPKAAVAKKNMKAAPVVTAGPSPRRLRRGGEASKSAAGNTASIVVVQETVQNVDVAPKTDGKRISAAKKRKDTAVVQSSEAVENVVAEVVGRSRGSRGSKKAVVHADTAAEKDATSAKGKVSDIASSMDSPVAGRRGNRSAIKRQLSTPSNKLSEVKSPASTRRRKLTVTFEESQQATDSSKVQEGSHGKKPRKTAVMADSIVFATPCTDARRRTRNPSESQQVAPRGSVSAKSAVATHRGNCQVAKESVSDKEKDDSPERPAGRKGKRLLEHTTPQQAAGKTPSRSRKRPQVFDEPSETPVPKSRRRHAEATLVPEQPSKQPEKEVSKSVRKKFGGKKDDKKSTRKVKENASQPVKKSGGKKDDGLQGIGKRKVTINVENKTVMSPPATRARRTRR